jgi:hypothetical protein
MSLRAGLGAFQGLGGTMQQRLGVQLRGRKIAWGQALCSGEQEDAGVAIIVYQKHVYQNGKARWLDV